MQFMDQNKKVGRPAFKSTKRMRDQVEIAVAAGLSHSQIATVLGISKQTLHTHLADSLKNGHARKLIQTLCLLDKQAKRGSVAAMKYLVNVYSQQATVRLGKKER